MKKNTQRTKHFLLKMLLTLTMCLPMLTQAQVAPYLFVSSSGTYAPITGGNPLGFPTNDDTSFGGAGNAFAIGFPFTYAGTVYNNFAVNTNGFIALGTGSSVTIASTYTALSSGPNNVIAGYNVDLVGTSTGELSYITTGAPGSRVLTIQWKDYTHFGGFPVAIAGTVNFQIQVRESNNTVVVAYGVFGGMGASKTMQVGLRGASGADFSNRTTAANWSATTSGITNADNCTADATIFPANGQTFTWSRVAACAAATFTTLVLPTGSLSTPYSQIVAATGGTAPYTFSISNGILPAGLALNTTTGEISGTPTVANISPPNFTVTISDAVTCISNKVYGIVVTAVPCTPISISPTTVPAGSLGVLYPATAVQFAGSGVAGATYNYAIIAGALPSGMSLNPSTGRLAGTPNKLPASPIVTIRARVTTGPSAGCFGTVDITLVINCPVITLMPIIPDAVVGTPYSQQLTASYDNGVPPTTTGFAFTTTSTLPNGFELSAGGLLTGPSIALTTPVSLVITASRGNGCSASQTYTFGVVPKIPAPKLLKAIQISSSSFRARWEPIERAARYRLYIATTPDFDGGSFAIGYVGLAVVGDTSILVQGLKPETKYYIQVTAISSGNEVSVYSNTEEATTLSAITGIDNALSSQVKVSPNPSNDKFLVDFGALSLGKTTARVYDAQGKKVLSSEISANQATISLGNMANGIYLLEITSNKGRILKRLIKE